MIKFIDNPNTSPPVFRFDELEPGTTFRIVNNPHRSRAIRLRLAARQYMNIEEDSSGQFNVKYGQISVDGGANYEVEKVDMIVKEVI